SSALPGLELVLPVIVALQGPTTGIEVTPELEARHRVGPLLAHVGVGLGIRHDRTPSFAAFVGNTIVVQNAFVARLVAGLDHDFGKRIHVWLEPLNAGMYIGGAAPALELS